MSRLRLFAPVLATVLLLPAAYPQVTFLDAVDTAVGDGSETLELAAIAQGDFDGDDDLDLVVTSTKLGILSDPVTVLLNDGDGTFTPGETLDVRIRPAAVAVADLNADGDLDLALALLGSSQAAVLLGDGTGGFGAAARYGVCDAVFLCSPVDVVAADIDGENGLDLVIANENEHMVTVLLNDGDADATYGTELNFTVELEQDGGSPLTTEPNGTAVADFDGDGHQDIAVVLKLRNRVGILLNDGTGNFSTMDTVEVGEDPVDVEAGLLDADSNVDLVVANMIDDTVTVLLGDGLGGFTAGGPYDTGNNPVDATLADMDGDGELDVVTANSEGDDVSVLLGAGDGTFGDPSDFDVGGGPVGVVAGDFDGDGEMDIATVNYESSVDDLDDVSILLAGTPVDDAIDDIADELVDCGAGTCGPAGAGTMMLSIVGLVGVKYGYRRRRG
jgi:hypothetical protein